MNARPVPVGVIGTGAMGLGVVQALLRAGVEVVARDIDPAAEERARRAGARIAATPAQAAREAATIVILVVDDAQVDQVLFGADGIASAGVEDRIALVSSTLDPDYVRALPARIAARGVTIVDAPVSGGPAKAAAGTMTMMLAGPAAALAAIDATLASITGRRFVVSTHPGDAAATKIVNNLLAGANLAAAGEALALADALGLDAAATADVIGASSGASWIATDRLPRALAGDYAPRAAAKILSKDLSIACAVAARAGVPDAFAGLAAATFRDAIAAGYGDDDDAAIVRRARERAAAARQRFGGEPSTS
jgi:3-hydroxyisobutyrate dehydrogenase-like beta-hydroxyacid dehydrogenase